ncbi:hypothetical protein JKF63_05676 [Porcisia hertigi]|uniref:Uncharacterized protein n=1 Tax=Porcisia hertigi TaxID=2761500 RepID=A0A836I2S5_9TRYP|nr:hypothetical protein JKF63_05676 [Porcisia hertigi]
MDPVVPPSPAAPALSTTHTITVALCASSKKHEQSFHALREAGRLHNQRLLHLQEQAGRSDACDGEGGAATTAQENNFESTDRRNSAMNPHPRSRKASRATLENATAADSPSRSVVNKCLFRFLDLSYDARRCRMVLCVDSDINRKSLSLSSVDKDAAADSTPSDAAELYQSTLMDEVDVVLHKVTTFGTPHAFQVFERWCKVVQRRRGQQRRPPLVVVEPLEKTLLLISRSLQCRFLDKVGDDGRPLAVIPRTFVWDCSPGASLSSTGRPIDSIAAIPLGIHSFRLMEEVEGARAHGTGTSRWWVAKPDNATGPAFTHHLVMWLSRDANVTVPSAVQLALPDEASSFILQELYVYALPVVVKVYCVGSHINIKVNPTVNLLARLWEQTNSSTAVDVPVVINSQDKALFSAAPPLPPTGPQGMSSVRANSEQLSIDWRSMVTPTDNWNAFFAPGTPAFIAIEKLAQSISGANGIGLSLFGFDLVLVPKHLAHAYQRKGARGIGHTKGATVRYERVAPSLSKQTHRCAGTPGAVQGLSLDDSQGTGPETGAKMPSSPMPLPFSASDMFDSLSGAPTSLLLDSIPVVIDINYFPSYKGIDKANQQLLELMAVRTAHAQNSSSSRLDKSGFHAKKRRCAMM